MIDSHCHLADAKFKEDLHEVVARAHAAGVQRMVTIGDSIEESERCVRIAEEFESVFCTAGVHPHVSKQWKDGDADRLRSLLTSSTKIVALGEIGLDYHYDFSPRETQRSVFREQLILANELKLPVVVHCREAVEDVWAIVDELKPSALVLHCCSERWEDVERFVERGYLLSFTGMITYPKTEHVRETVRACPLDRLMIETDAPYLAPVPHRGKRNEPAFVAEVARHVAEIKGLSIQDVDHATTQNAVRFFRLPS